MPWLPGYLGPDGIRRYALTLDPPAGLDPAARVVPGGAKGATLVSVPGPGNLWEVVHIVRTRYATPTMNNTCDQCGQAWPQPPPPPPTEEQPDDSAETEDGQDNAGMQPNDEPAKGDDSAAPT